jgi:hypothetical protein
MYVIVQIQQKNQKQVLKLSIVFSKKYLTAGCISNQ